MISIHAASELVFKSIDKFVHFTGVNSVNQLVSRQDQLIDICVTLLVHLNRHTKNIDNRIILTSVTKIGLIEFKLYSCFINGI
jgi:hypothetical protein